MIDIYLDGADLNAMREARKNPLIKGYTTNPSILRAAGVTDYERFAKDALQAVEGLPISFEVFSDEWDEMERQARKIASWGSNVNVKIPITNTKSESAAPLVQKLSNDGIVCNVTAVFTLLQVVNILHAINRKTETIISVFAGRIADTLRSPRAHMQEMLHYIRTDRNKKIKVLWASPRQTLDIRNAEDIGCHIITITPDLLKKYEQLKGKDLTEFSLDTCKMFYNDAAKAGYKL